MKTTMRILALVLVLVMAIGVFAGCQKTPDTTTNKPAGDGTTAGSGEGTTAGAVSNLPEYLKVGQFPLVEGEEITLRVAIMCHDNCVDPESTWGFKFLEEVVGINIDLEYFYTGTKAESVSLMFADGDLPDLMIGMDLDSSQLVQYGVVDEMLLDIKPYLTEENAPNILKAAAADPAWMPNLTTADGQIFSLGSWGEKNPANNAGVYRMFYNWDVMAECGIEKCPETLDEFLAMLRTIKKQKPEMYPFGGNYARYNATYLIQNALGFNLTLTAGEQKSHETDIGMRNGEITLFSYDKEMLPAYLEFMHTLYEEELMEPDYYTLEKDTAKAHLTSGLYAVFSEVPGLYGGVEFGQQWWGGVPMTSELNDTPFYPSNDVYDIGGYCISAETEYPELCVALADLHFVHNEMGDLLNNAPHVNQAEQYGLGVTTGWHYDWDLGTSVYDDFEAVKDQYSNQNYWIFENIYLWYNGNFRVSYLDWATDENGKAIPNDFWELNEPDVNKSAAKRRELEGFNTTMDYQWQYSQHNTWAKYETTEMTPKVCYFDADTLARVGDLKTLLDTYASQAIAEFITGKTEINEANLNAYFAEMEKLGADEYVKIYADYWAAVNG